LSDSQTHNLTTTLIESEHEAQLQQIHGDEIEPTPLTSQIFSPFGIKYQKERRKEEKVTPHHHCQCEHVQQHV
jgi:hypothetical protein